MKNLTALEINKVSGGDNKVKTYLLDRLRIHQHYERNLQLFKSCVAEGLVKYNKFLHHMYSMDIPPTSAVITEYSDELYRQITIKCYFDLYRDMIEYV